MEPAALSSIFGKPTNKLTYIQLILAQFQAIIVVQALVNAVLMIRDIMEFVIKTDVD